MTLVVRLACSLGLTLSACDEPPERAGGAWPIEVAPEVDRTLSHQYVEDAGPVIPTHPVQADALAERYGSLASLDAGTLGPTVGVLDLVPAPCTPCLDMSLARCALELPTTGCTNVPGLVERAALLAARGASPAELRASVSYGDVWLPFTHRAASEPPRPVHLELWVDPTRPFVADAVAIARAIDDPRVELALRFGPLAEGSRPLAQGAAAAWLQGRGLAWLAALEPIPEGALAAEVVAARTAGLDLDRWRADLPAAGALLDEDAALAPTLGVRGAPTWFVGGYRLRGPQSEATVRRVLAMELSDFDPVLP